ncbi:hypothetical protein H072_4510 [Dactylellina haptotyla CBS 200.50]|uniref:Uncharacterized protein n=1 Tax=Dactylellina haptotyla (strain CBS 200.50) TaxID=1284197 RepID=S8C1V9_DACHA|nr:hypothetical protein H072_4510 [Dactylellina haptotyla CBS 200.50]
MAPVPPSTAYSSDERRGLSSVTDPAAIRNLLQVAVRVFKRDLGPTQSQSVGMAVGLSIAGIVVAIFVFGWVRYIAAREHQRGAERAKAAEAEKAAEEGDPPAEEAPPAEE